MKLKEKINSDKLSKFIANCMDDKKAEDIRIINLKKIENSVTDYFVLATGKTITAELPAEWGCACKVCACALLTSQ